MYQSRQAPVVVMSAFDPKWTIKALMLGIRLNMRFLAIATSIGALAVYVALIGRDPGYSLLAPRGGFLPGANAVPRLAWRGPAVRV